MYNFFKYILTYTHYYSRFALFFCLVTFSIKSYSQVNPEIKNFTLQKDSAYPLIVSNKTLNSIHKKYSKLSTSIQANSENVLGKMQDAENKLKGKLKISDSSKVKEAFENINEKYNSLVEKIKTPLDKTNSKLTEYIPGFDSIQTALNFLNEPGFLTNQQTGKLGEVVNQMKALQQQIQVANEIQSFIRERESALKEKLLNSGVGKQLIGINKEVYYYQQKLNDYKEILNDKSKLKEKILSTVRSLPAFQKFWEKNSYLAQLFPQQGNYAPGEPIPGLQTRIDMQDILNERFGALLQANGGGGIIQQQLNKAEGQIHDLKNKLLHETPFEDGGASTNSDMVMPVFKPNSQKTKTFLERLKYGIDFQSSQSSYFLPVTSDIAFTVGYKLSDTKEIGFGASYKLGWGTGWNDIKITNEGIGFRGYADIKAPLLFSKKGGNGIWISGGFEYNYLSSFRGLQELHENVDVWQRSALMGITKKYTIPSGKGKMREGKIQLLYDFLHNKEIPNTTGWKFRVGWGF